MNPGASAQLGAVPQTVEEIRSITGTSELRYAIGQAQALILSLSFGQASRSDQILITAGISDLNQAIEFGEKKLEQ